MPGFELGSLIVDIVLVLLLGAVLIACIKVNRGLSIIRNGQAELADLAGRLDRATAQARTAITELKGESAKAENGLRGEIRKARALADELILITEAGDNLATRLEQGLTGDGAGAAAAEAEAGGRKVIHALREAR